VQKLDVMIASLRLLLANVSAKESQQTGLRRQLHGQLERLVSYSLYGEGELERNLALMSDVELRLNQTETDLRSLARIRERAEREMESLLLTRGVEHAKAQVAALHRRKAEIEEALTESAPRGGPDLDLQRAAELRDASQALDADIRRLQHEINEASERAARSLEGRRR
jgi:hypothetical protein